MKNLRNKRVTKMNVGMLKKALEPLSDDSEVVLGFYMKDEGVHYGYLAEVMGHIKFDSVLQEKSEGVIELACFHDDFCSYVERKDD